MVPGLTKPWLIANRTRYLNFSLAALVLVGLAAAFGCEAKEQIRSVHGRKANSGCGDCGANRACTEDAPPPWIPGEATDRMLVAIVPVGNRAHFFKVVGPAAAIEKRKDEFTEFFAKLKVVDGRPTWTSPEGWKEDPASGMRRRHYGFRPMASRWRCRSRHCRGAAAKRNF